MGVAAEAQGQEPEQESEKRLGLLDLLGTTFEEKIRSHAHATRTKAKTRMVLSDKDYRNVSLLALNKQNEEIEEAFLDKFKKK